MSERTKKGDILLSIRGLKIQGFSEEKWKRLKEDMQWLEEKLKNLKSAELKPELSARGFFIHAALVCPKT